MAETPPLPTPLAAVEAMAQGACEHLYPRAWRSLPEDQRSGWRAQEAAALTALCALHPGIRAVIEGSAVVVPREATPLPELTSEMARALPGGGMDDSTFSQIEDALDLAEAPSTAGGRWLTLVERIAALKASPYAPPAPGAEGGG